jgi:geranylgeranyl pyrophosphate synthase
MSLRRRVLEASLGSDSLGGDLRARLERLDGALDDLSGGTGAPKDFDPGVFVAPGIPRVRPLLVLLSERAARAHVEPAIDVPLGVDDLDATEHVAAAAELLHVAIVVHDRALGLPGGRRRRAARKLLGAVGWLGANHLTLRALELARHAPTPGIVDDALDALREIADGHALSESIRGRTASSSESEELAEGYTGAVFDFACRAGARVAGGDEGVIRALGRYGRHTGVAWHMADDLSSMEGEADLFAQAIEASLGRLSPNFAVSLGAEMDPSVGDLWMHLRQEQDDVLARELQARVRASGAILEGRSRLTQQTWRARKALHALKPSPHREALDRLAVAIAK